jgi:hypothetical protein
LVPPGSENEADAPKRNHQCWNQESDTGHECESLEKTDNQREKQRRDKGKARRFMIDEFLMCVCGSEESKKTPNATTRQENAEQRQCFLRVTCAAPHGEGCD